jgi:hypothetical protein
VRAGIVVLNQHVCWIPVRPHSPGTLFQFLEGFDVSVYKKKYGENQLKKTKVEQGQTLYAGQTVIFYTQKINVRATGEK